MKFFFRLFIILSILTPIFAIGFPMATEAEGSIPSPQDPGPCSVTTTTVELSGGSVDFHIPDNGSCTDGTIAPYPTVLFAHGFSLFGLSDGRVDNQGNGEHLASWGYVVGIPSLPDDFEDRANLLVSYLDFLEAAHVDEASILFGQVDLDRLATTGYSLGGATALAAAARDARVSVVVALDPVFHEGDPSGVEGAPVWDAALEAPNIVVPVGILGAPASSCNAGADFQDLYTLIESNQKASFEIVDASHCVFAAPGNSFCELSCTGTAEPFMTTLSQKYMTSWLNYYLKGNTVYSTYLYGAEALVDINANLIIRQYETLQESIFIPLISNR